MDPPTVLSWPHARPRVPVGSCHAVPVPDRLWGCGLSQGCFSLQKRGCDRGAGPSGPQAVSVGRGWGWAQGWGCLWERGQGWAWHWDRDRGGRLLVLALHRRGSPRRGWGSPSLRQLSPAVRLEDLVAVRYEEGQKQGQRVVLGTGGFGRVELVRATPGLRAPPADPVPVLAPTSTPVPQVRCRERLFALKRIRKDWVVRTQQQEHVRTERRVLAQSRCPFIVG